MKTFKKTLALFLATLMIVSAFAAYSVFATTNENEPAAASEPANEPVAQAETVTPSTDFEEETRGGVTAYYVDSLADFLAFNQSIVDNYASWYGKTIILTKDIDMEGYTWSQGTTFRGILDGQGHTIKNLNLQCAGMFNNLNSTVVDEETINPIIKNLSITGSVTAAHPAVLARDIAASANVTVQNVYIDMDITASSGTQYAGGFFGRHAGAGRVTFENCVSASTISGSAAGGIGGFIGQTNAYAFTVNMTDCAFIGDLSNATATAGVGGLIGYVRTNVNLTRCVVACKESTQTAYAALGNVNATAGGPYECNITDCYVATNSKNALAAGSSATYHTLTVTNGNSKDITVNSGTDISTQITAINAKIKTIATSTGATLNASNFHRLCTVLLANGWVMTNQTVTYGTGLTVPEIMPATVATMLERTTVETGNLVNAEKWHIKDNGDTLDIRFIGSIKEDAEHLANYDNVGMMIVVKEGDTELVNKQYNAKAVYTSMYTDVDGVEPIIAGEDTYLYTVDMRGFNKDSSYTVTFVAFATYNGVNILDYDGATTITVTSGEIS